MKKIFLLTSLAFSLNAFSQTPSYVSTNGLNGWWPFTGNANDMSTANNNGTVNGANLSTDRFANSNSAYSFDGVNDYIQVDTINLQSFSLSLWIYNTSINPLNLNGLISNLNATPYNGIEFRVEPDSTLMLVCGQGSSWLQPNTALHLMNNTWYHVVATSDDDTVKIFVNAQQIASYGISSLVNNNSDVLFGTRNPSVTNGGWYTGKLDDIGIWNRALNNTEINDLYNGNICFQYVTVTDTNYVTVIDTNYVTVIDTNYVTITDTNYISVADTLIINALLTGVAPPNNINIFKIFPNPTSDHITIDNGNISNLTGYQIKITNSLSQQVFQSNITQQQFYVDLSTWTGNGIYFVHIIDGQGNTIDIKKIVLQ